MQDAHAFLKALTIVLGVAAVTTVVFQRLRCGARAFPWQVPRSA